MLPMEWIAIVVVVALGLGVYADGLKRRAR